MNHFLRLLAPAVLILSAGGFRAAAQSVGIGTTTPNASAALDVSSTDKGLLPPRLSQAQRDALAAPAPGLLVFNTSTGRYNLFAGAADGGWVELLAGNSAGYDTPSTTHPARTFAYTGGEQTYTVPAGVSLLRVDASGGAGGGQAVAGSVGVAGGRVQAVVRVRPGEVLTVRVGGAGARANLGTIDGGYNGGASGAKVGGGGGATDLRRAASTGRTDDLLPSRNALLVAAGSGGSSGQVGGAGGQAGGGNGGAGGSLSNGLLGGGGATQSAGGSGGGVGLPGTLGQGGAPHVSSVGAGTPFNGGGGGGGYYGGGGGGVSCLDVCGSGSGGGGGGSSWVSPAALLGSVTYSAAPIAGPGSLTLTPLNSLPAPALDAANFTNLPASDNLGDHTARENLRLNNQWLSNDGESEGLRLDNSGNLGLGTAAPAATLHVAGGSSTVRLEGLGGTGTRLVTADANGNLSTRAQQSGLVSVGTSGNAYEARTVTFPTPFSSPPSVVLCTPRLDANGAVPNANLGMTAVVRNVTSTGFTVVVSRSDANVGWGTAVSVSWLALP
ncbi:H-type lectin domain-containing protein [Hymenobacter koreensis]|uniref:receptor protein-tyrosine kinase n=1 Tax=Hymenobacter koreensis TaxID=1084523 RepID=A0ABP8IU98_9BACT